MALIPFQPLPYTLNMRLSIRVIGRVENNLTKRECVDAEHLISRIIVDPDYRDALDGIDSFSHLTIIFWLDRMSPRERRILKVHPRGNTEIPLTGVFATHSPTRPNPIAVTTVELIKRDDNILIVRGLDALSGTPVIDIKGYFPSGIPESNLRLPRWGKNRHL